MGLLMAQRHRQRMPMGLQTPALTRRQSPALAVFQAPPPPPPPAKNSKAAPPPAKGKLPQGKGAQGGESVQYSSTV